VRCPDDGSGLESNDDDDDNNNNQWWFNFGLGFPGYPAQY
jgi:hypothetical protein